MRAPQDRSRWTVNGQAVATRAAAWTAATEAYRPGQPVEVRSAS